MSKNNVKMEGGGNIQGFTLVELLVVIAIIGILIALLLPAVQAAREAARRMECSSKMKNIALAVHTYHDANRCFPGGPVKDAPDAGQPSNFTRTRAVWAVAILPFMEQVPLFDMYQPTKSMADKTDRNGVHYDSGGSPTNIEIAMKSMPIYNCTSDPGAGNSYEHSSVSDKDKWPWPASSYRAIGGAQDEATNSTRYWDYTNTVADYIQMKGVFHFIGIAASATRSVNLNFETFASLTDGTSNVSMFTETHFSDQAAAPGSEGEGRYTSWSMIGAFNTVSASPLYSSHLRAHKWDECRNGAGIASSGNKNIWCSRGVGAYHTGGFNVALGDGSVRFTSETINTRLWADLAMIASGKSKGNF